MENCFLTTRWCIHTSMQKYFHCKNSHVQRGTCQLEFKVSVEGIINENRHGPQKSITQKSAFNSPHNDITVLVE